MMTPTKRQVSGKSSKLFCFALLALLLLCLPACSDKAPATADQFQKKLEAQEFQIVDVTGQYAQFAHILKALGTEKGSLHIEFLEINSNDNAAAMFQGNRARVEKFKASGAVESSVSAANYQKYSLTTSETFYVVSRIEKTLIYAYSAKADKDALQDILTSLDY